MGRMPRLLPGAVHESRWFQTSTAADRSQIRSSPRVRRLVGPDEHHLVLAQGDQRGALGPRRVTGLDEFGQHHQRLWAVELEFDVQS